VLILHGVSSLLLPRRAFLRLSGLLQVAGFVAVLADYILEPSMESLPALSAPDNQALLHVLPSYWFLGVFQELNGSMKPEFTGLARLGWIGLIIAGVGALGAVSLAYWRTMPLIIEEPEIQAAGPRWTRVSGLFGDSVRTAVLLFSWRTLTRSRQHRLMLGFFLSVGLIVMFLYALAPQAEHAMGKMSADTGADFLVGTMMMTCLSVLGARIVVLFPTALKANWIFQVTQTDSSSEYRTAVQRTLLTLGVAPAWLLSLALVIWSGANWGAVTHLCALALAGVIFVNVAMLNLHKLPFACSWIPGKINVLVTFFGGVIVGIPLANLAGDYESVLLRSPAGRLALLTGLALIAGASRWFLRFMPASSKLLSFEDIEQPALLDLNLRQP
jgi:hypothetical protein